MVVNVLIELNVKQSEKIYSSITHNSFNELGIKKGEHAIAIIKASSVLLSKEKAFCRLWKFIVKAKSFKSWATQTNTEITLELPSLSTITATIANELYAPLNLKINDEAYAFSKPPMLF